MSAVASASRPNLVGYDPLRDKTYQSAGLGRPITDYLARKTNQGCRPATLEEKERYLAALALMFPTKTLGDVGPSDLDHWLAQAKGLPTRRAMQSHARDFFRWALKWSLIDRNPVDMLDSIPKGKQKTYDIFSEGEIAQLVSSPLPDGPLLLAMFDAGLRRSECIALQGKHILPEPVPGQIRVVGGKGDKDRLIPLTLRLSQALNELMLMDGIGRNDWLWYTKRGGRTITHKTRPAEATFYGWWKRALEQADVRYRNPHMARHTFATRYLRAGGRLETLTTVLGHSSIKTTSDEYAHLDTRDAAIDIRLLEV